MKLNYIALLSFSFTLYAQEHAQPNKVYHISMDPNPIAQMAASVQKEYAAFKRMHHLKLQRNSDTNNAVQTQGAENNRAKL